MRSQNDFTTELLYFSHGYASSTGMHSHSYCQLEYCIDGKLIASSLGREIVLLPGEFWLIPPEIEHKFHKTDSPQDFISIKFRATDCPEPQVSRDPVCLFHLDTIRDLIDGKGRFKTYSQESRIVIEDALSCLLRHLAKMPEHPRTSDFEANLLNAVLQSGAAISIDELADFFKLTKAQFKYRFGKEFGNGNIKRHIDGVLLKMAERQLLYSALSLSQIARELRFSSLYAFSRYFKHHRGKSPSEFRMEHLTGGHPLR